MRGILKFSFLPYGATSLPYGIIKAQIGCPLSELKREVRCPSEHDFLDCSACGDLARDRSPKLWRGRGACPEILETVRDASKAAAEVASGCELCFDRLPRAVDSV